MSAFKIDIVATNPKDEELSTPPTEALVDTGSELTWLPAGLLKGIGIMSRGKKAFITATGERIEREVGYAILKAEGRETNGDMILLGVRTLEGFSVMVDNIGHRLVSRAFLAARL
jgi:predicted aspartyl protease